MFDRIRRIAYYYPQRSYNFVAFDDPEDDQKGKYELISIQFSLIGSNIVCYCLLLNPIIFKFCQGVDKKRKKRNLLYYPQHGTSYPMYGMEDDYQGMIL